MTAPFERGRGRGRGGLARAVLRWLLALAMMSVGVLHFVDPAPFVRIVPAQLPAAELLVYLSGVFEILLGGALLVPRARPWAGLGLAALYVAVFPANVNMAVNHLDLDPAHPLPSWAAWARLPFQALFIAWALWVRKEPAAPAPRASSAPPP